MSLKWPIKNYISQKHPFPNKEAIIQLFSHYASGSDPHVDTIEWNQLTSIEKAEGGVAYFKFGESN